MFNTPDIVEAPPGQDPRWQAIVARDRNFDGRYYYAV
jgi:methylphosphotriester-DNA--protein-cysteine methyltransferase